MDTSDQLIGMYRTLDRSFGPLRWWPADTPFEVAVGAILTQNTNWANVQKAIGRIKANGAMSPEALYGLEDEALWELIRPSGYFRVKGRRLKAFLAVLCGDFAGDLERCSAGTFTMRAEGCSPSPGSGRKPRTVSCSMRAEGLSS